MMKLATTILMAVIPSLLLLRYFYRRDLHPEPRGVLLKTFLLGILITVPIIILVSPVNALLHPAMHPLLYGALVAFLCAAIPEELFKFLVLTRYSARHPAFDEPMDGIVYGATVSLGFATLENILYVAQGGWVTALLRGFTAVPCHACLGAIMGYYIGQARFGRNRRGKMFLGLFAAILLHGLYDFPLLSLHGLAGNPRYAMSPSVVIAAYAVCLAVLLVEIIWMLRIVRRLRREQEGSMPSISTPAAVE
ncbi:MAG: heme exporter protein CcmD [bacterium]|nr:heme exporter protein CcmD [bacterium]